jgi:RPA family protein
MKYIYTLLAIVFVSFQAKSQCSDLFFSEYIEGSSNNKAIEIFNPTNTAIDLGTYRVNLYTNGNSTPNSTNSINLPSGTMLGSGEVFIIANAGADPIILALADFTGGPANFNGNDAVELVDTTTGNTIDVIGLIGEDPGAAGWTVGSGTTTNFTLVRKAATNDGTDNWAAGALTWEVFDQNFFDSLGTHFVTSCEVVVPTPTISFAATTASVVESGGSATVRINVLNITEAVSFTIALDGSSTASGADATAAPLGTFSFTSGTADTFVDVTITITDDAVVESDETVVLKIENASGDANVVNDTYTLTISDDDVASVNPCGDLFFSEYIEGSSNNKALEVYNPTSAAIDLGKYKINRYNNGGLDVSGSFSFPSGVFLGAGEVYVIANSEADSAAILTIADTTSSITFYNGDDALELVDTTTNTQLDIIGVIGEDPGASWPVGAGSTVNFTLVRKISVNEGITNWAASSVTWDVYPVDSFTFLGAHTMTPCEPEICETVTITVTGVVTNETVLGDEDGAINASVSGGTGTYTYSWNNGANTEDINGLAAGNYTLTATDGNGCIGTASFTVAPGVDPCAAVTITVTGTVTPETALGDNDGAINASVSGGTGTYNYSWSNSATTEDISGLAPGNYTLTATDGNGCSGSAVFTVAAGVDPCAAVTIAVTGTVTNETELGDNDGAINASVSGGTGTYTYSWSNSATTEDISGLAPGNYTLTATDGNGCSGSAVFTVAAGVDPCASVVIVISIDVTDESVAGLNDGAIDATISGGAAPYTTNWSNGATTEDISGLTPATYTLSVTDANGCSGTASATVDAGTVGVSDIASLNKLSVYPNPVASILNVDLQFKTTETVQLQIVDLMGRTVFELQRESVLSKTYSLYPQLPSGVYLLKVLVDNKLAIEPFVVQ